MVSFFVDISVKAVVDRDDKHVAVNSKADRNASVAGQGVVCCGFGWKPLPCLDRRTGKGGRHAACKAVSEDGEMFL